MLAKSRSSCRIGLRLHMAILATVLRGQGDCALLNVNSTVTPLPLAESEAVGSANNPSSVQTT